MKIWFILDFHFKITNLSYFNFIKNFRFSYDLEGMLKHDYQALYHSVRYHQ